MLREVITCVPFVNTRISLESLVKLPAQPEPRITMRSRSPLPASRASRPTVALVGDDCEKQRVDARDL